MRCSGWLPPARIQDVLCSYAYVVRYANHCNKLIKRKIINN